MKWLNIGFIAVILLIIIFPPTSVKKLYISNSGLSYYEMASVNYKFIFTLAASPSNFEESLKKRDHTNYDINVPVWLAQLAFIFAIYFLAVRLYRA